jgi:hypothetical protein
MTGSLDWGATIALDPIRRRRHLRWTRKIRFGNHLRLELGGEAFNLFNGDMKRGYMSDNVFLILTAKPRSNTRGQRQAVTILLIISSLQIS